MDCSPQSSSVHRNLQARILEWLAVSSSRGSSRHRDWTCISCVSCTAGRFFIGWAIGEADAGPSNLLQKEEMLEAEFNHTGNWPVTHAHTVKPHGKPWTVKLRWPFWLPAPHVYDHKSMQGVTCPGDNGRCAFGISLNRPVHPFLGLVLTYPFLS